MRRNRATDPVDRARRRSYRSRLVQQVINKVMLDGKKSTAERIVYDGLAIVGERSGRDPTDVLDEAVKRAHPGPRGPLPPRRRGHLSGARRGPGSAAPGRSPSAGSSTSPANRNEKSMSERLAREIMDAASQQGGAYKRKDDIYRMAQANKAFAHYRW